METIISALISGVVAIIVCVFTTHAEHKKSQAVLDYKLEELTKKVEKHNSLVEKTYDLERLTHVQDEQIKVANHRIDDLEKKVFS